MHILRYVPIVFIFGCIFSSCNATTQPSSTPLPASLTQPSSTPLPASLKGYELYSWPAGGQWRFALLVGTNREKTLAEIKAPATALTGLDALQTVLSHLPPRQEIIWMKKDSLSFPPDASINQVEHVCKEAGLILHIAR